MFKIGDLIVDTEYNSKLFPSNLGAGIITEIKNVNEEISYIIDFPLLKNPTKISEKDLITNIGIGIYEYYPVKRTH